ncbi:MAG: helix-turn-helix transcriptional regulator [Dehalococcoidia bacterium]
MTDIGDLLKELRLLKRLTIRDAAQAANVSNAYLSQIETGKKGAPSAKHLRRLAEVYGVPARELFEIAGYLDEPEIHESEDDQINRAFDFVMADSRFAAGTRIKQGLTLDAKRYIVETYEKVTGARLLGLK